jgi:hypothetical protein
MYSLANHPDHSTAQNSNKKANFWVNIRNQQQAWATNSTSFGNFLSTLKKFSNFGIPTGVVALRVKKSCSQI